MRKMKKTSINPDPENDVHLELLDEEDGRDTLVDDYKNLELELVKSTRRRFLTWNEF